ncbi:methyl-accepting chemotaxis protein [Burkholderia pseudomallei]|uniref:methyl-accepting chemotaxis protein n=2 Tax=Burkholderia pseudomallei TaxID=28450 RepID=UPI000F044FF1|nr:methyl-accepting chemotaxis protein [Burkholderia pseudomallei]MCD4522318.1 methyl-accepting chemotaxis protein [Burkholderia pseudomallei]MCW0133943.1 methyl-accepting chemotaxis protein [Burkholderia pseudomallei]CAJ5217599.1 methyl-accepting chemotaxis protein [Burkholderia pseudomallei]VBP44807.1 methyl-accepting chemotaxis protein [Burkholderia pseudomallei]
MNTTRLTVKTRLRILVAIVVLVLAAAGGIGLAGVARVGDALTHVFEDRAKTLQRISSVDELVTQARYAVGDAVLDPSAAKTEAVAAAAARDVAAIDRLLADFRATPRAGAEREQAERLAADWATLRDKGIRPAVDLLKANNLSEAQWVVTQTLDPVAQRVKGEAAQLRQNQLEAAQRAYDRARGVARLVQWAVAGCVLAGVAAVAILCAAMARALARQLGGEPDYAASVANEIASGNLALDLHAADAAAGSVLHAMHAMRARLAATIGTLQRAADAIAHATSDIAHGNHDLSRRTDEHAAGLQQTASSMEQLAATVRTNADHARQASALALAASTQAEQGDAAARDAIARMEALSVRSQQIRSISSTIEGIAFQTNLLALNAAVEAARAGQAGRGFAVVAQEVRGLAHSSAQAAKEISALIADVTGEVELGADTVKAAGSTIVGMLASVRQVATLVDEISHASDEQRSGIDQVNQVSRAVAQMDEMTQHNALLVQKAAGAAGALADEAAALREAAAIFRVVA